ncbi:MAG: hypothetical protein WD184_02620 [Acidimicrobiia bacterium]
MTALVIVEAVVVLLLAVLVIGLLRSHGEILRALRDLGIELDEADATAVPRPLPRRTTDSLAAADIVGITPEGSQRMVGVVGARHTTMLAFLSSGCLTCANFWEAFGREELAMPGEDTHLVIVTKGPEAESPAAIAAKAPRRMTTVMSTEAWDHYGVPITPYFVLVDGPSGQIAGEGAAANWRQLESLMAQAAADGGLLNRATRGGSTSDRLDRADEELAAAGISPDHPSLLANRAQDVEEGGE